MGEGSWNRARRGSSTGSNPGRFTGRIFVLGNLMVLVTTLCQASVRTISTSQDVVWLIDRAYEIQLPPQLPACIQRWIHNQDLEDDAKDALEGALEKSAEGVMDYWQFTCDEAPDFYKAMKRFWKQSSRARKHRLQVAPLAWLLASRESSIPRRRVIASFVLSILKEEVSLPDSMISGQAPMPDSIRGIIGGLLSDPELVELHKFVLDGLMHQLLPLSDEMTDLVLSLATGPHSQGNDELLMKDNELLSSTAVHRDVDKKALSYLLRCVESDQCDACRAWCVSGDLITRYGEKLVLPAYLKALGELSEETPVLAWSLVRALGGRYSEAGPSLVALLRMSNVELKAIAISGLEKIFGIGEEELGYKDLHRLRWRWCLLSDESLCTNVQQQAVELISKKWLSWWDKRQAETGPRGDR